MDQAHPSNQSRRPQKAILALNLAGYGVGALTILGYAWIGLLQPIVAAAYFGIGALVNIGLYAWIQRLSDEAVRAKSFPTYVFLWLNVGVQLGFAVWQPQIAFFAMLILIGIVPIEVLRFRRRQIAFMYGLIAVMTLIALLLSDGRWSIPSEGWPQKALLWVAFTEALAFSLATQIVKERYSRKLVQHTEKIRDEFVVQGHALQIGLSLGIVIQQQAQPVDALTLMRRA